MTRTTILSFLLLALAAGASAENVDLVTLPDRGSVQLTIYNSEDITLVRETRRITLKRGHNRLQFSWANTLIDPTSVEFRPLEHADSIELQDTVFPGQKPQHLIWNLDSQVEGQVAVEVSYFTSGLTWGMDYTAITDPQEERLHFRGFVHVFNRSGEEYDGAEIRLIVGTINLVEKIADLARRKGIPVPAPASDEMRALRRDAAKEAFDKAELAREMPAAGAKQIVKEGLSEYFMFTIEGQETVRNGWSKRMRAVEARDVPFEILYRMRAHQYGPRPVRFFLWRNDEEHKLAGSPLPDGQVRLFRDNGRDGLAYLGAQIVRYVPIGAPIEINLGPDDLVVYESRKASTERLNFSFRSNGGREYVTGWDEKVRWIDEIRNYRTKPIRFELHRQWAGDVVYTSEIATRLFDYRTIEVAFDIEPRGRMLYPCTVVTSNGSNASQAHISLQ